MASTNNTNVPLIAGATFIGLGQLTNAFTNIRVSIRSDKLSELTIQQSQNLVHWDFDERWTCDPAKSPTGFTCQTPVQGAYFRVKLENLTAQNMTLLRLNSVLNMVSNVHLDVRQDNTLISGEDALGAKHTLATTSTGDLIINGTGGSATRPVYLMSVGTWYRVASVGNTPGHVWTSIGAIVGGEAEPTIGRLFKCLSVPSNIQGQGEVYDVEYSDTVTATPVGTQDVNIVSTVTVPVSGSVALLPAVDPTLTVGTVRLTDSYGAGVAATAGNLMVGINNIYTANPLHTILDSGSVALLPAVDPTLTVGTVRLTDSYGAGVAATAGNLMVGINNIYTANPLHTILDSGTVAVTGSVAVTNADITSIKTNTARFGLAIGSNYEESVINTFSNLSITGGYLYNLSVYSAGTVGINFLKVYGVAGATIADTPLLIVPVPAGQSVNLSLGGLKALTGISVRATTTWAIAGNTSPSNPISCNLTFSPLV